MEDYIFMLHQVSHEKPTFWLWVLSSLSSYICNLNPSYSDRFFVVIFLHLTVITRLWLLLTQAVALSQAVPDILLVAVSTHVWRSGTERYCLQCCQRRRVSASYSMQMLYFPMQIYLGNSANFICILHMWTHMFSTMVWSFTLMSWSLT